MQTNGCGHFSVEVELISVPHTSVVLRVPVRRCAVAERMVLILSRTDEGREVAAKIQIMSSTVPGPDQDAATRIRAAFGPDLEAINRVECTTERCRESCTPGFRQVLRHFRYTEEAGQETGDGCLELSPETAEAAS